MDTIQTTIRLPKETIDALDNQATTWFTTRNKTIYRIIQEWQHLKQREAPHAETMYPRQNMD